MYLFLTSTILFVIIQTNRASTDYDLVWRIEEDLKALNVSCLLHSCSSHRMYGDNLLYSGCQCGAICAKYGTCCIDSPYIDPTKISPTCKSLDAERSYYIEDRCPPASPWKFLCEEDWNGDNDVMKMLPVTSLFTYINYKNYFCFRCQEPNSDFRYWNIELGSNEVLHKPTGNHKPVSLTYDGYNRTWLSPLGDGGSLVAVNLNVKSPLYMLPCDTQMISSCSDTWSDEDVKKKCEAYMAVKYIRKNYTSYSYKNVHCAICNFEDVKEMYCHYGYIYAFNIGGGSGNKVPFSFTFLIDINQSDGDLVGKIQRCGSTQAWDPFAKICKNLGCVLPGYVVRNGKCEAP